MELPKQFDITKFKVLGMYNDSRGKDSCGIYSNGDITYGVNENKLFQSCAEKGLINHAKMNKMNVVLGHCRKASVGTVGLDTAQPVPVFGEDGEIDLVMIHNGTLLNYKELAEKYNVEYDNKETDSQIFAKVVYVAGYKVLGEYEGAGAFVFYEPKNNTVRIFKGESKKYASSKEAEEERPLCFYKEKSRKVIWFSSMLDSLDFIKENDEQVYTFTANTLYTVVNGEIIDREAIDRSERFQLKTVATNYGSSNRTTSNVTKFSYIRDISHERSTEDSKSKQIYFHRGHYYFGDNLANGIYDVTYDGEVGAAYASYKIAFFKGYLLDSFKDYEQVKDFELGSKEDLTCLAYFMRADEPFYNEFTGKWEKLSKNRDAIVEITEAQIKPLFSKIQYNLLANGCGILMNDLVTRTYIEYNSEFGKNAKEV